VSALSAKGWTVMDSSRPHGTCIGAETVMTDVIRPSPVWASTPAFHVYRKAEKLAGLGLGRARLVMHCPL